MAAGIPHGVYFGMQYRAFVLQPAVVASSYDFAIVNQNGADWYAVFTVSLFSLCQGFVEKIGV